MPINAFASLGSIKATLKIEYLTFGKKGTVRRVMPALLKKAIEGSGKCQGLLYSYYRAESDGSGQVKEDRKAFTLLIEKLLNKLN